MLLKETPFETVGLLKNLLNPAWRAYNTPPPVVAAYGYDMLGRVAEIDAVTVRVKLTYDYVAQEHNIAGGRFCSHNCYILFANIYV
ncbi:MAG: hypothetical protein ABFD91_01660 [Anaerohalosphaeraceae bacterium]